MHFAKLYHNFTDAPLELGNLDSKRDWGFAGDYVEMMWKMLQHKEPDTYVIATGKTHSIRDFVNETGKHCDFDIEWEGAKEKEIGINKKTNKCVVIVNKKFYRPAEVDLLLGNAEKTKNVLGWTAKKIFMLYAK
jgi:GDPmannose 4,6-dehydratase